MLGGQRIAGKVGAIVHHRGRHRRQEVVGELQHLRHAAGHVAGGRIDRNAFDIVAGAVDQVAVLVQREVAAAGVVVDTGEHRLVIAETARLLHHKEAGAIDRHVGGDRGGLHVALHRVGLARPGLDAAGKLVVHPGFGDQVHEAGVDPLEGGGLGVGDVAGDVFQRIGLCAQARNGGGECAEKTHDIVSNFDPGGKPVFTKPKPLSKGDVASCVPRTIDQQIQLLKENAPADQPGHSCLSRQELPRNHRKQSALRGRGLRRLEAQRQPVHAVAQPGRLRPVVEHMAEMAAAAAAMHFGPQHHEGAVLGGGHRIGQRLVEARPAGAAVELGLGGEQRLVATGASEGSLAMLLVQRAAVGPLGAMLAQDAVLRRGQLAMPLLRGPGHLEALGLALGCVGLTEAQPAKGGKKRQAGDGGQQNAAVDHGRLPTKSDAGHLATLRGAPRQVTDSTPGSYTRCADDAHFLASCGEPWFRAQGVLTSVIGRVSAPRADPCSVAAGSTRPERPAPRRAVRALRAAMALSSCARDRARAPSRYRARMPAAVACPRDHEMTA